MMWETALIFAALVLQRTSVLSNSGTTHRLDPALLSPALQRSEYTVPMLDNSGAILSNIFGGRSLTAGDATFRPSPLADSHDWRPATASVHAPARSGKDKAWPVTARSLAADARAGEEGVDKERADIRSNRESRLFRFDSTSKTVAPNVEKSYKTIGTLSPHNNILSHMFFNDAINSEGFYKIPARTHVILPNSAIYSNASSVHSPPDQESNTIPSNHRKDPEPDDEKAELYKIALERLKEAGHLKRISFPKEIDGKQAHINSSASKITFDKYSDTSETTPLVQSLDSYNSSSSISHIFPKFLSRTGLIVDEAKNQREARIDTRTRLRKEFSSNEDQSFLSMWHDAFSSSVNKPSLRTTESNPDNFHSTNPNYHIPSSEGKTIEHNDHENSLNTNNETEVVESYWFSPSSRDPTSFPKQHLQYYSPQHSSSEPHYTDSNVRYQFTSLNRDSILSEEDTSEILQADDVIKYMKTMIDDNPTPTESADEIVLSHFPEAKYGFEPEKAIDGDEESLEQIQPILESTTEALYFTSDHESIKREDTLAYLLESRDNNNAKSTPQTHLLEKFRNGQVSATDKQHNSHSSKNIIYENFSFRPKQESILEDYTEKQEYHQNLDHPENQLLPNNDAVDVNSHFQSPFERRPFESNYHSSFRVVNAYANEDHLKEIGLNSAKEITATNPSFTDLRRTSEVQQHKSTHFHTADNFSWKPVSMISPHIYPKLQTVNGETSRLVPDDTQTDVVDSRPLQLDTAVLQNHPIRFNRLKHRRRIPRPSLYQKQVWNNTAIRPDSRKPSVKPSKMEVAYATDSNVENSPMRLRPHLSWASRIYNFITGSIFGRSKDRNPYPAMSINQEQEPTLSGFREYQENGTNFRRQFWPRTDRIPNTEAPVVGSTEYLTITTVAALGTLTSIALFAFNNPLGGRGSRTPADNTLSPVERTVKFLTDAALEYESYSNRDNQSQSLLFSNSEWIKEDNQFNHEKYLHQMLNSINEKHTKNIKNNLALFVLNAYEQLKKYPSDVGINKILNSGLKFYTKIKSSIPKLDMVWRSMRKIIQGESTNDDSSTSEISKNISMALPKFPVEDTELFEARTLPFSFSDSGKFYMIDDSATTLPIIEVPSSSITNVVMGTKPPIAEFLSLTMPSVGLTARLSEAATQDKSSTVVGTTTIAMRENSHPLRKLGLPNSRYAYKELRVSPFSRSDLTELSNKPETERRVVINNVLQTYSKVYPVGSLDSHLGVLPPSYSPQSRSLPLAAVGGVFINNELHAPSSPLVYKVPETA